MVGEAGRDGQRVRESMLAVGWAYRFLGGFKAKNHWKPSLLLKSSRKRCLNGGNDLHLLFCQNFQEVK